MKKIIIVLSIVSLVLLLGGIYLIKAIDVNTSRYNEIIMFHQVELLRGHLLLNIREIETDLYSHNTPRAAIIDRVDRQIRETALEIEGCFACHHSEKITEQLLDLKHHFGEYGHAVSRAFIMSSNSARLQAEQGDTHRIGHALINKLSTMLIMTKKMLAIRTADTLQKVQRTRILLIILVAAGPLLVIGLAFTVITGVKKPVEVLLEATRKLQTGDLEHRVEGLRDEFAELSDGLNTMAVALKERLLEREESEKRYRLLFESAGNSIMIIDAEERQIGRIMEANKAAAKMHGYSVEELKAMSIADLDVQGTNAISPLWVERMRRGEWINVEAEHRNKDGVIFPVEISAGEFEFGGHRFFLAIERDITERKKTEETLQRSEQLRMAGELATGLAHEIKNPLAGIKVSIEVLAREPYLPEEDRGVLVQVIEEIKRIEVLMKELLNFARPPRSQFFSTNVNTILDAAASLVRQKTVPTPEEESRAVAIVKDFDSCLPEITADPMQLKQIFLNLLLNAVDAMPEGGTLFLKTRFDEEAKSIRVEVADTGKGIDSKVMHKLFHPFFTTKAKGTGLGLAISKRLIEDHGGRIAVTQNAEGGATFKIVLPTIQSERGLHHER